MLSKRGYIERPGEITLGNNVFINRNFYISARDLYFGDNIMIGPNLVIECDNHVFNMVGETIFKLKDIRNTKGIKIENDVWIGANVTILPGAIIREGSVIGAGSVVTKEQPPYSVSFGNPCRPFKPRFTREKLKEHLIQMNSNYTYEEVIKYISKYYDFTD
ncbi:MAG: acyltransferase [Ignavibacteriales bacterium]|nr:acyltransferase [Ignavibacteriales bacterium]